jgi:hypothetical protein
VVASGVVEYTAQNGTVIWVEALTAPLVPRQQLEIDSFWMKFSLSAEMGSVIRKSDLLLFLPNRCCCYSLYLFFCLLMLCT